MNLASRLMVIQLRFVSKAFYCNIMPKTAMRVHYELLPRSFQFVFVTNSSLLELVSMQNVIDHFHMAYLVSTFILPPYFQELKENSFESSILTCFTTALSSSLIYCVN